MEPNEVMENFDLSETGTSDTFEFETLMAIQESVENIEKITFLSGGFVGIAIGVLLASIMAHYLKH